MCSSDLFVVVLGIYLVLAMLLPNLGKLPVDRADAFAYVVANLLLLPGVFPITPIITVAWSLSFEALFYLTVPLVAHGFDLQCRTSSQRSTGLVGLALGIGLGVGGTSSAHARLVMFVVGMLAFELASRDWSWRLPSGFVSGVLTLFGVVVGARGEMGLLWHYGVLSLGFLLMCLEALRAGSPTALALAWSPLRWLGAMSYSYFLIHGLAANALVAALRLLAPEFIGHELGFWLALTVTFVWTLVPAATLFALVEKPWSFPMSTGSASASSR